MIKSNFKDKKIAILGYGVENQFLFNWLIKHGANIITICDKNSKLEVLNSKQIQSLKSKIQNLEFRLGKDYLKNLEDFDIIFRTPGIPYLNPEIQKAKKKGVKISSQIKLFFKLCPAKIIGVTGTKGKGTTASLIFEILKKENTKVYFGGNIGNAPIEFLDQLDKKDLVVLELSSFQLQDLDKSPYIAVVLDIKSDHLDYHKNQKEYEDAKANIVKHQTKKDFTVINLDYLTSFKFAVTSPTKNDYYFSRRKSVDLGCYIKWDNNLGKVILRTANKDYEIIDTKNIILRGKHNLENIAAAVTASYLAGATAKVISSVVGKFKGLEHRLEFVSEIKKVKYYNDSFSTTPDTAIAAINSFQEPIILLLGGSEKNADYNKLAKKIVQSSVKTIIPIGKTALRIIKKMQQSDNLVSKKINITKNCPTMQEAVAMAKNHSVSGDVVLLSPASASFDHYKNYKDRGNQFKSAVADLKS